MLRGAEEKTHSSGGGEKGITKVLELGWSGGLVGVLPRSRDVCFKPKARQTNRNAAIAAAWLGDCRATSGCLQLCGDDYAAGLRDDAGDGDVGAGQSVDDLALTQARGVVLESNLVGVFIMAEAAQAVGVGEFAEVGHLF